MAIFVFLLALLAAITALAACPERGEIDANRATASQWMDLTGAGREQAERLVKDIQSDPLEGFSELEHVLRVNYRLPMPNQPVRVCAVKPTEEDLKRSYGQELINVNSSSASLLRALTDYGVTDREIRALAERNSRSTSFQTREAFYKYLDGFCSPAVNRTCRPAIVLRPAE